MAAKLEWVDGDEERVECAIHFAITQHIPTDAAITLDRRPPRVLVMPSNVARSMETSNARN